MEISKKVNDMLGYVVDTRRKLHMNPELSCLEFKTAEFIEDQLKNFKLKTKRISKTGIICDISGLDKSYMIALRCDIDALAITEKLDLPFKSMNNGVMHACGHDGHTTILLAMAQLLSSDKPKCNIRLIFQFGEEGSGGAEIMIEGGALDNVDEIYAFHLCPELKVGHIATCEGALFAGVVEFDAEFDGKSCHCADKFNGKGIDSLTAAIAYVLETEKLNEKYKNKCLFHVGKLSAGTARNIVSQNAKLECTLRYYDIDIQEKIMMEIASILVKIDNKVGTSHRLTVRAVYPPLNNSGYAVSNLKKVCDLEDIEPRFTAEDFAFYTQKIPGCMSWLGIKDNEYSSPLHSSSFGFNERALLYGIEAFSRLVYTRSEN